MANIIVVVGLLIFLVIAIDFFGRIAKNWRGAIAQANAKQKIVLETKETPREIVARAERASCASLMAAWIVVLVAIFAISLQMPGSFGEAVDIMRGLSLRILNALYALLEEPQTYNWNLYT